MHIRCISKAPAMAEVPTALDDMDTVVGYLAHFFTMVTALFAAITNGRMAIEGFKS